MTHSDPIIEALIKRIEALEARLLTYQAYWPVPLPYAPNVPYPNGPAPIYPATTTFYPLSYISGGMGSGGNVGNSIG